MFQHRKTYMGTLLINVQMTLHKLIKVGQFISEIWTLINRVSIYIFDILKYHGLMSCTRFLGITRLIG